jgi:hypothetical protein
VPASHEEHHSRRVCGWPYDKKEAFLYTMKPCKPEEENGHKTIGVVRG